MSRWVFYSSIIFPILFNVGFSENNGDARTNKLIQNISDQERQFYLLAQKYIENRKYDSALMLYHRALKGYRNNKNYKGEASILNNLGVLHYRTGNTDSCIIYYKRALKIYSDHNDSVNQASTAVNLGITYKKLGSYELALENLLNAIRILEKSDDSAALATCYNTIANTYSRESEYEKAIIYHRKSLRLRRQNGHQKEIASSLNNIGIIFRKISNYDSALYYLNESLKLKRTLGNKEHIASTLNNIGVLLLNKNQLEEAKDNLLEALNHRIKASDEAGVAITLNNLGKVYNQQGDYQKALNVLDSAFSIISNQGLQEDLKDNLESKIFAFKQIGNLTKALALSSQLIKVKDSLLNTEKVQSLVEMQTKYESEKKEQSIAILEKEKELQMAEIELKRLWITILIISIILVLLIGLFAYNRYLLANKNKKKVETLMQELHHRVKNNLQLLSSIFSLQSRVIKDKNALEAVKSGENRVNAMAIIHQKLYKKSESRSINIQEYINNLVGELSESYGYEMNNKNVSIRIEEIDLDVDKVIPIGLIVNELVSNTFKYSFPVISEPHLSIHLKKLKHGLQLTVSDNGNGFDINKKSDQSMGLNIIETLSRQLGGKIKWSTDSGVKFELKIPLNS